MESTRYTQSSGCSLRRLAYEEAERHKWIESEKAGRDLGDDAVVDWSRRFWRAYLRERWIEHLMGLVRWRELSEADFGLLQRDFHPNRELVATIVDRIRCGGENADILYWVACSGRCVEDAEEILLRLNINAVRMGFRHS